MRRYIALILALVMLLSAPAFAADGETGTIDGTETELDTTAALLDVLELLREYGLEYSGESYEELIAAALVEYLKNNPEALEEFLNTLMQQQDRYSYYMKPETYDSAFSPESTFVGIGVTLDSESPYSGRITGVFVGSPAEEAGLLAGDIIISVDGRNVEGLHTSELAEYIRGDEGTYVTLGILRGGEQLSFSVERRQITMSDVEFRDLGDNIAYIRISRFGDIRTFVDFLTAITQVRDGGFRAVVYDVRDNLGGDVEVLYNILQYTISNEDAEIFSLVPRTGGAEVYYSAGAGCYLNSVAVLINGNTASAAEMFAGAMKYGGGAKLFGGKSYGKGVGQLHFTLPDNSVAVLTGFEILLPGGIAYNEIGIEPDAAVENLIVEFPDYSTLAPLGSSPLSLGSRGRAVFALERRLELLGYFTGEPDAVFDDSTLAAANEFRQYRGLPVTNVVDADTLHELDSLFVEYSGMRVRFDRQLEEAVRYLLPRAHLPLGCGGVSAYAK